MSGGAGADREGELASALAADAAALVVLVDETWSIAVDPLGEPMLLPRAAGGEPLPLGALPWRELRARFHERHGRPPAPGARMIAQRRLESAPGRGSP